MREKAVSFYGAGAHIRLPDRAAGGRAVILPVARSNSRWGDRPVIAEKRVLLGQSAVD